jgi:hypothetical protein
MIDLLYTLVAAPICAPLAAICMCRLNILHPTHSKPSWRIFYLTSAIVAAGVGFEALMHPDIFYSAQLKLLCRIIGVSVCSALLYYVLGNSWQWHKLGRVQDSPPSESNRAPLGDI